MTCKSFQITRAFLLILVLLAGMQRVCRAAPTLPSPFAKGALNVMPEYAQTLQNGTPAQIAAWYAPTGELLLPGTAPLSGPKEVEAFLVPLVKQAKVTNVSVHVEIGQGSARYATLLGTYSETFVASDSKAQTVTGRFASLWENDAHSHWHILRLMMQPAPISSTPPAVLPAPATP